MFPRRLHRLRQLITDDFDDAMISLALRDAYPHVRFVSGVNAFQSAALVEGPTIPEAGAGVVRIYFPPPGWEPEFRIANPSTPSYVLAILPEPWALYGRGQWFWGNKWFPEAKWAFSLPTREHGHMSMSYDPDAAEQRALMRSVWRLLERLTTNALRGVQPKIDRPALMKDLRGGMFWAGHHALEWCSQAPDRMLDGCRRPADDWRFPDDPWLLDLRRRVIERFGPDYGAPPQ